MRLSALEAVFVGEYRPGSYRRLPSIDGAQGVLFLCPLCEARRQAAGPAADLPVHSVLIWFKHPCGAPAVPAEASTGPSSWAFMGTSLEDLTLSPSVNLNGPGSGWHGWVRSGDAA